MASHDPAGTGLHLLLYRLLALHLHLIKGQCYHLFGLAAPFQQPVSYFRQHFEIPNRPVILTDVVSKWPAMHKWSRKHLRKAFRNTRVIVGEYPMDFDKYLTYMDGNADEMPLYLFDKHFADKAPSLAQDYQLPPQFSDDLFAAMGEKDRPDHRWLIFGPARSGSSFHQDPNATSAWNAVIYGSKKWILYPPHITPPGVHASADGADVAAPLSLTEWFMNFHKQARKGPHPAIETTVRAGELLFVPRGWWHMAINLEETLAITHNYVSTVNLPHVLKFLGSGREDLVSGCAIQDRVFLHDRFIAALRKHNPEALAGAQLPPISRTPSKKLLSHLFQNSSPDVRAHDLNLNCTNNATAEIGYMVRNHMPPAHRGEQDFKNHWTEPSGCGMGSDM
ncbi:hypothetical protein WJX84_003525 [Apatococcus fuscideae]|uniref:JmjC domain-containing protein n=1 Tax=Apatococcus fuscideae TaxID=2026836 RepID=A0AAW1SQE6_9CHLO